MPEWIEPIFSRAAEDLERLAELSSRIKASGYASLAEAERSEWENSMIGAWNARDWNREEGDTYLLHRELDQRGYGASPIPDSSFKWTWAQTDILFIPDVERIRGNVAELISRYYPQGGDPLPSSLSRPTYRDINAIEQILSNMRQMLQDMVAGFRYCGTFACGQGEIVLP